MISSTMPSAKIFLLRAAAQIGEGQDRDRRLVGEGRAGADLRHCRSGHRDHTAGSDRPRDVFEALLPDILEGEVEAARGVLLNAGRDADAARLGQAFEPGCDIDAVAKDVAILDDDVPLVDADAERDTAFRRQQGIGCGHF
jgi:hypothetical protein